MKKRMYINLIIAALSLALSLGIAEIAVRSFGKFDRDGNFYFQSKKLMPYKLPIRSTQEKIDKFLPLPFTFDVYDSQLGWIPRPNYSTEDGRYHHNSNGIRVIMPNKEYSKKPDDNTLRIALFGDSYVLGDEVPYEHTWGFYLENALKKAGINAEVINFGVGGYGTDQAFLRWKTLGKEYSPHIVILGFQPENTKRNVNLIRAIYNPRTSLVFSKPRFILKKNVLTPINIPTMKPKEIIDVMENIDSWDLAQYEYWLVQYREKIWQKSKLLSLIVDRIPQLLKLFKFSDDHYYSLNEEPAMITRKIVEEFKRDVETNGMKFYVVYLPSEPFFQDILEGNKKHYHELLKEIQETAYMINPEQQLLFEANQSTPKSLFLISHYSPRANKIVADVIAASIINQKEEK